MPASLLGTTGNWGIPQDEAGILITDLSFDYSNQEKPVLDKGGEIRLFCAHDPVELERMAAEGTAA